jgi:hypothetical protein
MSETKKALLKSMEKKNSQASVKNDFNSDNPLGIPLLTKIIKKQTKINLKKKRD